MRVTRKNLEAKVAYLNSLTGEKEEAYTKDENGKFTANIGTYTLSGAYGGYALERICTKGGGVSSISGMGHVPARELMHFLNGYINGVETK